MGRLLAALLIASVIFALLMRPYGPATSMRKVAGSYLWNLDTGNLEEAYGLLTDSLRGEVAVPLLEHLSDSTAPGRLLLKGREARGYAVAEKGADGSSRMVWLRREGDGWRVGGDSSLDGVLGRASMMCREHAGEVVLPSVMAGRSPENYSCPVTGAAYHLSPDSGRLVCPAGHLGDGLNVTGLACSQRRDSVAATVAEYLAEGHPYPSSLPEMWRSSGGRFGQRGGYRCPDNAYAYYRLLPDSTVYCPHHDAATEVAVCPGSGPDETR
ncbi:hypothetical protein GF402_02010 [Candidatus Fermentibacteria bacterium]|nr:hypothetical protein [Candidatus Fermentibacteria bacterium]